MRFSRNQNFIVIASATFLTSLTTLAQSTASEDSRSKSLQARTAKRAQIRKRVCQETALRERPALTADPRVAQRVVPAAVTQEWKRVNPAAAAEPGQAKKLLITDTNCAAIDQDAPISPPSLWTQRRIKICF